MTLLSEGRVVKRDVVDAIESLLAHRTEDLGCYEFVLEAWMEEAASEIKHLRSERRWIPVSEQLPPPPASEWEDGVRVLAWSKGNGIDPAWFYRDSEYGDRWSWDSTTQPTHWMPLPEPPSAL